MHHPSLFLFLLLLLAASPLVATAATFNCVGGVYKANSTYEANLRRLAAVLPAETASSQDLQATRGVGYWPNRPRASSRCYWGVSPSSCAACVAGAFREAQRECPYGKKAVVFARNCTLSLADFPRALGFRTISWLDLLGAGLVFQAIGFAWLFFLLLQEWRDKRRASMMRCSSLPSGDQ
ncbi:unnamed protein product [Triticum turgidum subsp. durum]|uniref:Gnk2-homologous domain-containing protein n=1 Tax=Triticum turgidum subsp. durum TaxID=4567 RepID=A0A9R0YDN3_TRITD|nr:unnamed protein product [Triticum turgidum subsp. durum]